VAALVGLEEGIGEYRATLRPSCLRGRAGRRESWTYFRHREDGRCVCIVRRNGSGSSRPWVWECWVPRAASEFHMASRYPPR
jgi:hypothetical protein